MLQIATLLIALALVSCKSLPPAPEIDLCDLDIAAMGKFCDPTNGGDQFFVPLAEMDKDKCVSNEHWGDVQIYIDKLKAVIEQ